MDINILKTVLGSEKMGRDVIAKKFGITEQEARKYVAVQRNSNILRQALMDEPPFIEEEVMDANYQDFLDLSKQKLKFDLYKITAPKSESRETVAIVQLSDQHIDEVVKPESVLGMNEYNLEIAEERQKKVYASATKLIGHHQQHYNIKKVILLFEGDSIGNWIHPELEQTNSLTPNEAIYKFKSLAISGIKYMHDNLDIDEITCVCIAGNHPRETKRIQYANFTQVNKEYWMYKDMEETIKMMGLNKVKFIIPNAEMAVMELFGKRYLVAHGHQFKYNGGVGGIFPSMLRWFGSITKALQVEAAFIGHWHQSIFTKRVIVNGSPKGYDAYAIGKGLEFEPPSQNLILLDSKFGMCNFQQIVL